MIAQRAVPAALPERRFEMRDLWRVMLWGFGAAGAIALAAFASTTERGNDRLMALAVQLRLAPAPARVAETTPPTVPNPETALLAETVKTLAADRDRLTARLNSLERTLDVTAAVPRGPDPSTVVAAPAATPPPPQIAQPETVTVQTVLPRPAPQMQPVAPAVQASVAPEPAEAAAVTPPPAPARPQYGLDLGSATTVEGLRLLWTNAKSRHGTALEGLRPLMIVRDHARPGGVELRLIAGPVPNAAAAARLCAAMAGTVCQPAVYEGQRLALR